jgi:hypothetical protein
VAHFIQEERNELTHLSPVYLQNLLTEYRLSLPAAQRAGPMNVVFQKAVKEVQEGLNELDELHSLYKLQMERIKIDFQTEKNIKKLLPSMTQEVRTAREILSSAAQLKMDLGIHDRKLGTVGVEATILADVATRYADSPGVVKVLDSAESRRKVLAVAEKLLSMADRAERTPETIDVLSGGQRDAPDDVVESSHGEDVVSDDADVFDMPSESEG